jgi:hypothetical protein
MEIKGQTGQRNQTQISGDFGRELEEIRVVDYNNPTSVTGIPFGQ